MKLRQIKPNPKNPRTIRDRNFYKLVDNLLRYPKFLEKRPIVYKDGIAQGGNMRYRGLEHILKLSEADFVKLADKNSLSPELLTEWAGYRKSKDLPEGWFKDAADFTEEELAAFIVIDNVNAGDWDFDALANDWDETQLADWGLEFPTLTPFPGNADYAAGSEYNDLSEEDFDEMEGFDPVGSTSDLLKISFSFDNELAANEWLEKTFETLPEIKKAGGAQGRIWAVNLTSNA